MMPVDLDLWTETLNRNKKQISDSDRIIKTQQKDRKAFTIFIEE